MILHTLQYVSLAILWKLCLTHQTTTICTTEEISKNDMTKVDKTSQWFLMGSRVITYASFYVPTECGILHGMTREPVIQTWLPSSWLFGSPPVHHHNPYFLCPPESMIRILISRRTLTQCDEPANSSYPLHCSVFFKNDGNLLANCSCLQAIESHHYQTLRSTPNSQPPCRTILQVVHVCKF